MLFHYLLWCSGEDRKGIVAALTQVLFRKGCNIEDSSMMRLGSEFAVFLILSTTKKLSRTDFGSLESQRGLNVGLKPISRRQATFRPVQRHPSIVSVHGPDRPGIVYRVTDCMAKHGFNITDLSTHRTKGGKRPGFILFIEGEIEKRKLPSLTSALKKIERSIGTRITIHPISAHPL